MKAWQKIWRAPLFRHSTLAFLICLAVLVLTFLTGWIAFKLFFSFWFGVFLFIFTPTWVLCYGLILSSRMKWHELSLGVFAAIFLITWVDMYDAGRLSYRVLFSTALAIFGLGTMSIGVFAAWLFRSLRRDVRQALVKRRSAILLRRPNLPR